MNESREKYMKRLWLDEWMADHDVELAADAYDELLAALSQQPEARGVVDVLRDAMKAVHEASQDYLPPDGITKDEFIDRVLAATDNAAVTEAMK